MPRLSSRVYLVRSFTASPSRRVADVFVLWNSFQECTGENSINFAVKVAECLCYYLVLSASEQEKPHWLPRGSHLTWSLLGRNARPSDLFVDMLRSQLSSVVTSQLTLREMISELGSADELADEP